MRNRILRWITGAVVFALAILAFELTMHDLSSGETAEWTPCSFPVVTMEYDGEEINLLYGRVRPGSLSGQRPPLTPLSEDRLVSFRIYDYGRQLSGLCYEIWSLNGARLLEKGELITGESVWDERAGSAMHRQNFTASGIFPEGEEALLRIYMESDGRELSFDTRIVRSSERGLTEELAFVRRFHAAAISGEDSEGIVTYLESRSSDETDLSHVDITASYARITYGSLHPTENSPVIPRILDMQTETSLIALDSVLTGSLESDTESEEDSEGNATAHAVYDVAEVFRLRRGDERLYLLNYDRRMQQRFRGENAGLSGTDRLYLGIVPAVNLRESSGGGALSAAVGSQILNYLPADGVLCRIYGEKSAVPGDLRELGQTEHVRILDMDESGGVVFAAYGYFRSGVREGEVGLALYRYDQASCTLEELAFIPYDEGDAQRLMAQVDQLCYYDPDGDLYFLMGNKIGCLEDGEREIRVLAEGLGPADYRISESQRMAAWRTAEGLQFVDFEDGILREIPRESAAALIPLDFIQEDLILGSAVRAEMDSAGDGSAYYRMDRIRIVDSALNVLETVTESEGYLTGCRIADNAIRFDRIVPGVETGSYVSAEPVQILSNQVKESSANHVTTVRDPLQGTIQTLTGRHLRTEKLRLIAPRVSMAREGDRIVHFKAPEIETANATADVSAGSVADAENATTTGAEASITAGDIGAAPTYFAYTPYGLTAFLTDPAAAIRIADAEGGVVVDDAGACLWVRGNRQERNQIMAIKDRPDLAGLPGTETALTALLDYAGASPAGESAYSDLAAEISARVPGAQALRLTGITLDAALYYIHVERPVMALTQEGSAVLITGYNDSIIVALLPSDGKLHRIPRRTAAETLRLTGTYVTYR